MDKKNSLFFITLFCSLSLSAQTERNFSGWGAVFSSYRFSPKFSIHLDGQLRSTDEIRHLQSFLIRPGLNFHVSGNKILTIGYAYIKNRRVIDETAYMLPEHRIWEQFIYNQNLDISGHTTSLQHRFRLEQRFIGKTYPDENSMLIDGYEFSHRLRYFVRGVFPIVKTKSFTDGAFISLQDEIFVNIDNAPTLTNGNFFDQNRAYMSLGWRFSPKFDLECGYMYQYVNGKNTDVKNNIIQLAAYVRL